MTREEWERRVRAFATGIAADTAAFFIEHGYPAPSEIVHISATLNKSTQVMDYDSVREAFLNTMFKPGTIRAVCEICGEPKQFDREVPPNYYECECKERGRGE